eukprot:m.8762 g.8762  ORF g.8762 m.8762 type:complete len:818 (-) comp3953_c0_seq1:229-2682(-)
MAKKGNKKRQNNNQENMRPTQAPPASKSNKKGKGKVSTLSNPQENTTTTLSTMASGCTQCAVCPQSQKRKEPSFCLDIPQIKKLESCVAWPITVVPAMPSTGVHLFPEIKITPHSLVLHIVEALSLRGTEVRDVRLEGSCAAHILSPASIPSYNDLDFVFYLDSDGDRSHLESCRGTVLNVIQHQLARQQKEQGKQEETLYPHTPPPSLPNTPLKPDLNDLALAYVRKMFITRQPGSNASDDGSNGCDEDSWSMLQVQCGNGDMITSIDLKFVQRIARPYQFSADSFQIDIPMSEEAFDCIMDTDRRRSVGSLPAVAINIIDATNSPPTTPTTPTRRPSYAQAAKKDTEEPVVFRVYSSYPGDNSSSLCGLHDALAHVNEKYIAVTKEADMASVRGGGLLKYVSYLMKGFKCGPNIDEHRLENYILCRFLIDFPGDVTNMYGIPVQCQVFVDYLTSRWRVMDKPSIEGQLKYLYRMREVVTRNMDVNRVQELLGVLDFFIAGAGHTINYLEMQGAHGNAVPFAIPTVRPLSPANVHCVPPIVMAPPFIPSTPPSSLGSAHKLHPDQQTSPALSVTSYNSEESDDNIDETIPKTQDNYPSSPSYSSPSMSDTEKDTGRLTPPEDGSGSQTPTKTSSRNTPTARCLHKTNKDHERWSTRSEETESVTDSEGLVLYSGSRNMIAPLEFDADCMNPESSSSGAEGGEFVYRVRTTRKHRKPSMEMAPSPQDLSPISTPNMKKKPVASFIDADHILLNQSNPSSGSEAPPSPTKAKATSSKRPPATQEQRKRIRAQRCCLVCGQYGHTRTKCPILTQTPTST